MTQHQIVLLGQFWGQAVPEDLHCHPCRRLFCLYPCPQHTSFEESTENIYPCTLHAEQKAMSQIAVRPMRFHHHFCKAPTACEEQTFIVVLIAGIRQED